MAGSHAGAWEPVGRISFQLISTQLESAIRTYFSFPRSRYNFSLLVPTLPRGDACPGSKKYQHRQAPFSPTPRAYVIIAHSGNPSNLGTSSSSLSQAALLDKKICAVGSMDISVSRHPAGTTSKPSICVLGKADPHTLQKLLL